MNHLSKYQFISLLFQHLFEFGNHIHVYNYLMFDFFAAKIMMNVVNVQLEKIKI
jgi:hypothetical protein